MTTSLTEGFNEFIEPQKENAERTPEIADSHFFFPRSFLLLLSKLAPYIWLK
jgi:hypothetical protein